MHGLFKCVKAENADLAAVIVSRVDKGDETMEKLSECIGGFGGKKSNNGTQYYQQDRVYSMNDISLALPSQLPGGSYNYLEIKEVTEMNEENAIVLSHLGVGGAERICLRYERNLPLPAGDTVQRCSEDSNQTGNAGRLYPLRNRGGVRLELPNIADTQRASARERKDKSDTNNGEYP